MESTRFFSRRLFQSTAPFSHIAFTEDGAIGYVSGLIGQRPESGALVGPEAVAQAEQTFTNLRTLLEEVELSLAAVLRVTLYLTDMADYSAVNTVYARHFSVPFPARSIVGVVALPMSSRIQLDAVIDPFASHP